MKNISNSLIKIVLGVIVILSVTQSLKSAQGKEQASKFQTLAKHSLSAVALL